MPFHRRCTRPPGGVWPSPEQHRLAADGPGHRRDDSGAMPLVERQQEYRNAASARARQTASVDFLVDDAPGDEPVDFDHQPAATPSLPQSAVMSTAEVAALFNRKARTVRSWAQRGLLQPLRIGGAVFYRRSEIERMVCSVVPDDVND